MNTPHPYDLVIGLDRSDKKADLGLITTATGSFNWLPGATDITLERKLIWSLRPQGTSAKNWSPDPIGAAALRFEWIALGCTAKSFWAARWRLITALEGRDRF